MDYMDILWGEDGVPRPGMGILVYPSPDRDGYTRYDFESVNEEHGPSEKIARMRELLKKHSYLDVIECER